MPKKVVKKDNWGLLVKWMKIQEDLMGQLGELYFDEKESNNRMRVAIWSLVIYSVILTGSFLLVLYGNQYLVK